VLPKPAHLGPEYGGQFADRSVVAAYHLRPPYPAAVFDTLVSLVVPPGTVLDIGTGTGEIARPLVGRVLAVDALDPAAGMLAKGQDLPGGDHPGLTWTLGSAETGPLRPPYGLIVAGASLHWTEWTTVLPRLRAALAPAGHLAIVDLIVASNPWDGPLGELIARYSTNPQFRPYDLVAELVQRRLFHERGRYRTASVPFVQPVAAYVESFHARNGFSRDRMAPALAAAFDTAVTGLVAPHAGDGVVRLSVAGEIVWGMPAPD
jgi:SAM-dependent methyltransferase